MLCVVVSHILHSFSTGLRLYCRHLEAQTWYLDRYWCLSSPVGSGLSISITCLPAYVVSATEMAHNLLSMCTGLWGKAYPAVGANQWANPEEDKSYGKNVRDMLIWLVCVLLLLLSAMFLWCHFWIHNAVSYIQAFELFMAHFLVADSTSSKCVWWWWVTCEIHNQWYARTHVSDAPVQYELSIY